MPIYKAPSADISSITTPRRVQLRRTKGWRMPPGAIYVGRPTKWGNPFNFRPSDCCWLALSFGCRGDINGRLQASVLAYCDWLGTVEYERGVTIKAGAKKIDIGRRFQIKAPAPRVCEIVTELRGHDLACWCPLDQPCHADVLLEIANGRP